MVRTKDLSGDKPLYDYNGILVELCSTFKYEITVYKLCKKGFCQLDSKVYKADKLLHIKKRCIILKKEDYLIRKDIILIGVPIDFINEMQLSTYKPKKK